MHLIDTIPKNACCKASLKYGIELFLKNDEEHFSRFQDPYEREKIDEFIQKLKPSEKSKKKLFELINDSETLFDEDAIINDSIFKCTSCKSNFLKGVFIACGTITNPDHAYNLELILPDRQLIGPLMDILESLDMPPKFQVRRNQIILYYKDSELLEDFLNYIGAQKTAFDVMNTKILKDLRNNANRLANCDAANIDKTVSAAQNVINAINLIRSNKKMHLLPDELKKTAQLRIQYSDAPLSELAKLHEPPISKSGLNHRLKKIIEFSKNC